MSHETLADRYLRVRMAAFSPSPQYPLENTIDDADFTRLIDAIVGHQKRSADLEAENAALRKDRDRLDWLDTEVTLNGEVEAVQLYHAGSITLVGANRGAKGSHANVRAALDAARKEDSK